MARHGYCKHGTYIGMGTGKEGITVELNGEKVLIPTPGCYQCEGERKEAARQHEARQSAEKYSVRENFLRLLREDNAFREEVRALLDIPQNQDGLLYLMHE